MAECYFRAAPTCSFMSTPAEGNHQSPASQSNPHSLLLFDETLGAFLILRAPWGHWWSWPLHQPEGEGRMKGPYGPCHPTHTFFSSLGVWDSLKPLCDQSWNTNPPCSVSGQATWTKFNYLIIDFPFLWFQRYIFFLRKFLLSNFFLKLEFNSFQSRLLCICFFQLSLAFAFHSDSELFLQRCYAIRKKQYLPIWVYQVFSLFYSEIIFCCPLALIPDNSMCL